MINNKLNIHYIQHEKYEKLFAIEDWAIKTGHNLSRTFFRIGEKQPELENIDWLVIMGGSMSANDESNFPWLIEEKKFIEKAIKHGKVVIGVCLGAQLIADVLGAKVYKSKYKEIGWFKISFTDAAMNSKLFNSSANSMIVFHWHGETFDLPDGAVLMASSEACENQIFTFNDNIIGLQCHLEQTELSLKEMVKFGNKELVKDIYIQSASEILGGLKNVENNHILLNKLLSKLAE